MSNVNVLNFMSNVDGDSWVHRLDPRTKVAILFFFSTLPIIFSNPWFVVTIILLVLPLWLTAKLDYRSMAGPLIGTGIFLFTIFLFSVFRVGPEGAEMYSGKPSEAGAPSTPAADLPDPPPESVDEGDSGGWKTHIGPFMISMGTITRALYISSRLLVPLTIGLLMISTTDPTYMAKGLRKLKMPMEAVFMVLVGLRFIPIFTEQLFNILDAQTVRGVGKSRFQRFKLLLMPLFISSLRRTRTMGLSCETRGFNARKWNDFIDEFLLMRNDVIVLGLLLILTAASLIARYVFGIGGGFNIGY